MIAVANRIFVAPQFADRFEDRFRTRAGQVDQMPGFVRNLVLRPLAPGDPYVVLTFWESRAQFDAWTKSEAFTQAHARAAALPREAFTAANKLEIHEVALDSAERRAS